MSVSDLVASNLGASLLVGTINNTDDPVTFSVSPGDGNLKFPTLGGSKYFRFLIKKSDGTYEILKATSRTGDSITAVRAQEGTSKLAFTAGAVVSHRLTAQDINDIVGNFASYLPLAGGTLSGPLVLAADPASAMQAATKQYADSLVTATTGDVKLTLKTTADSGWVMLNDGSIGDGSSGATTRANADTSALFTLLWTNISNADAPVSGGRGASAAADFAAHKTLTLTKTLGRALAISGAGASLTARTLGNALGAETSSHQHGATGLTGTFNQQTSSAQSGTGAYNANQSVVGITFGGSVQSTAPSIMQPTTFLNAMIKL